MAELMETGNISRPYSIRPEHAERYFGFKAKTIHEWVNTGRLIRGKHYLKVGKCTCIIVDAFIQFMKEVDGYAGDN